MCHFGMVISIRELHDMDAFVSGTAGVLKGKALLDYLMEHAGMHWDSVPVPGIRAGELDARAIEAYRANA